VFADAKAALTFKLAHDDLSRYNAVQKVLYSGVILCGVIIVLSGLAIWKPVQFQELTTLFGGYDVARYVHFFAMAAIVGFLVVHVVLALLVPKSLRAMVVGK
jgi:thiosulfate reductase cytochrome b subunit